MRVMSAPKYALLLNYHHIDISYLTPIGTLSGMDALMNDELRLLWECCTTIGTSMGFHIFMGSHMLWQMTFESPRANVAKERFNIFMETC